MQRIDTPAAGGVRDALLMAVGDLAIIGHLVVVVALLLVVGVVLPAVWSSRLDRRRDARAVLRLILRAIPTRPSPSRPVPRKGRSGRMTT